MSSSSSDNENTAIWDCDDFVPGMFLPTYEEDNKEEEEEEDGEDRERDNTIYSLNGDYNWIVVIVIVIVNINTTPSTPLTEFQPGGDNIFP